MEKTPYLRLLVMIWIHIGWYRRLVAKKHFVQYRQRGNENDTDSNYFDVLGQAEAETLVHPGFQKIAAQHHGAHPGNAAEDIVKDKGRFVHTHDAGNDGCKGADDGQEFGKED